MSENPSDFSPKLSLPFLLPAQAQKHVTVNESLAAIDALVMCAVQAIDIAIPPAEPASGEAYILTDTPSGDWTDQDGKLAVWADGVWNFYTPQPGWRVWVAEESRLKIFDGTDWINAADLAASNLGTLGVNAVPDETNRLSVKSDAVLLSHDDVTPGTGDLRLTLNKQAPTATTSLVFQSDWSGRSEIGLTGDEDLSFRVSADGTVWSTCLQFDAATGHAGLGAAPTSLDRLRIEGQLAITDVANAISIMPGGQVDITRADGGPIFLSGRSHGSPLHLGVTDATGTFHSNALSLHPNDQLALTSFTLAPVFGTSIDLGLPFIPFRDLYLTNAPVISSDKRGKTEIETFDAGLELLQSLNPVTYERIGEPGRRHIGLIAQHVKEVLEEQGFEASNIWRIADPNDPDSQQAIAYSAFIPVLIDAVNELAERVEELEARQR